MNYGIVKLSIVPLRGEPGHRSEQISQLLFGEIYEVLQEQQGWLLIKCLYDDYQGWINGSQHSLLSERDFLLWQESTKAIALETACTASSSDSILAVLAGSSLPSFDGLNFKIGREKFVYNGQAIIPDGARNPVLLEKVAMRYLNAPYLWGGRSPFGIDCSGFTQIVFKFLNIPLKRDAYQQAEEGMALNFLEESAVGDLAFFANEEGKITHTGILLKDNRIIHASGKVRIDKIDHFGIFQAETKKYSHQLKIIRRVL
ncbi:MAG: C40 family peptidase [Chitinophagales bacterium]